jgi:SAM-dependent methyltransferase
MTEERLFPASAMPDKDWWRALWPTPEAAVRSWGIRPGMTVIDLCCGDGYFTAAIARRAAPGRVVGVDLDPAMLKQARAACQGSGNCAWVLGDARELSRLVAKPVDYVLIANTFHGVADQAALAREAAAVLKPQGRFAIVNWHALPREKTAVLGQPRGPRTELRMSPQQVRSVVEPAGFELDKLVELPPYHYAIIFKSMKEINNTLLR